MSVRICVAVVLILSTAGCLGIFDQEGTSAVFTGINEGNETATFEVFVIDDSTKFNVSESDGKFYRDEVYGVISVTDPSEGHHFTKISPSAYKYQRNLTVDAGESRAINFTDVSSNHAFLVAVHNSESQIVGYATMDCESGAFEMDVRYHDNGIIGDAHCL